jgi:hypothetical protein
MIYPGVDTLAPEADIVYSLVTCSPLSECALQLMAASEYLRRFPMLCFPVDLPSNAIYSTSLTCPDCIIHLKMMNKLYQNPMDLQVIILTKKVS